MLSICLRSAGDFFIGKKGSFAAREASGESCNALERSSLAEYE
jgi:hypothetical protein